MRASGSTLAFGRLPWPRCERRRNFIPTRGLDVKRSAQRYVGVASCTTEEASEQRIQNNARLGQLTAEFEKKAAHPLAIN
jgi:hypothetical protein